MPEIVIRDLAEKTLEILRGRARAHGHSLEVEARHILEVEVRHILDVTAQPTKEEALARLDAIRARVRPWQPGEPTSAEMIREDRDSP